MESKPDIFLSSWDSQCIERQTHWSPIDIGNSVIKGEYRTECYENM